MTTFKGAVLIGLLLLGTSILAGETEQQDDKKGGWSYDENLRYESPEGGFQLNMLNRAQVRAVWVDPEVGSSGSSFDLEHYKLSFEGQALDDWQFGIQVNFADGSETSEELLEDAWVKYKKNRMAQLWAGQGKVLFGRQFMTRQDKLAFVDRSIVSERFAHGRDVGFAVGGENKKGTYSYLVGAYNGNGINRGDDENQDYMISGRLAVTPLGPMELDETATCWTEEGKSCQKISLGVAIISNKEGTTSLEEQRTTTANLELAYRVAGFNFVGEFFTENQDEVLAPPGVEVETDGWYGQASYLCKNNFEFALRFAEIISDAVDNDVQEAGGAVGYYFLGHRAKLQADFRDVEFEGIQSTGRTDTTETRIQLQLVF